MSYKYMLRLAIQPGFHEDEKLEEMVRFCKEARINDVIFFIDCEELNTGHITKEEAQPWLDLIGKAKSLLEPLGITTSINPWITTLHSDRGRALRPGQDFTLMVDRHGLQATAVACPLCPNWRRYITEMYAYYATLQPHVLWVEDDFRLHNHAPLEWGGCFCERHMQEYSRRVGMKLTREEFVEGVLRPGEPHPYRQVWLDTSRETMVELAGMIGDAVHKVSPATRVGLMSSSPAVHCAEGRDWHGILTNLSGPDVPPVSRPHLPAYSDRTGQDYLWDFAAVSDLTRALVPETTEIYPELENFPMTRFSKSASFMRHEIESTLALGAAGITMNIFDMIGNGVARRSGYESLLSEIKDYLSEVTSLGLSEQNRTGVRMLVSPESSSTLHTPAGARMQELYPSETFWAGLLSSFGIANTYSTEIPTGEVVAVSGQYFRNLERNEIERLFENNFVLLEGEAAWTLYEMGRGDLAGIESVVWHEEGDGFASYEQVCDGRDYFGFPDARMTAQAVTGGFLEIGYSAQPVLKSVAKNPFGLTVAPGMAVCRDHVLILPYGGFGEKRQGILNPVKQDILQGVLQEYAGSACPVFVRGLPHVSIYSYGLGENTALLVLNSYSDPVEEFTIFAPGLGVDGAVEINRQSGRIAARIDREGDDLRITSPLSPLESRVFILS